MASVAVAMTRAPPRTRPVDPARPLSVLLSSDVGHGECVPARVSAHVSTGMEKEEEQEIHLQGAIVAQQASASGQRVSDDNHVIPTPKVEELKPAQYGHLYKERPQPHPHKMRKVQAWVCLEAERAQYDADAADDKWLAQRPHVSARTLEHVFQQLEQESSETQVCMPSVARQRLQHLDESIVDEVYDYWLQKREAATTSRSTLIPRLRTEARRDAGGQINPYVAFRRRAEKMQTRRNRKNDEDSYEKVLKLTYDLHKTVRLLELLKRREKTKLALIDIENDILLRRIAMVKKEDMAKGQQGQSTIGISEATKENGALDDMESFVRTHQEKSRHTTRRFNGGTLPTSSTFLDKEIPSQAWLKKNHEAWHRIPPEGYSSILGSLSRDWNVILGAPTGIGETSSTPFADAGQPGAPYDARFTFKRRRGCHYRAPGPIPSTSKQQDERRAQQQSGSASDISPAYRICSAATCDPSLWVSARVARASPSESPWMGQMRRRVGRGGRVLHDYVPRGPKTTDAGWLNDLSSTNSPFDLTVVDTAAASTECPWRGEWNTSVPADQIDFEQIAPLDDDNDDDDDDDVGSPTTKMDVTTVEESANCVSQHNDELSSEKTRSSSPGSPLSPPPSQALLVKRDSNCETMRPQLVNGVGGKQQVEMDGGASAALIRPRAPAAETAPTGDHPVGLAPARPPIDAGHAALVLAASSIKEEDDDEQRHEQQQHDKNVLAAAAAPLLPPPCT